MLLGINCQPKKDTKPEGKNNNSDSNASEPKVNISVNFHMFYIFMDHVLYEYSFHTNRLYSYQYK